MLGVLFTVHRNEREDGRSDNEEVLSVEKIAEDGRPWICIQTRESDGALAKITEWEALALAKALLGAVIVDIPTIIPTK
jgi:hypothetical protein